MVAAPDTIAALVNALLCSVLSCQRSMNAIESELQLLAQQSCKTPGAIPSWKDVKSCSYFMACIQEALRLYPPIPIVLSRRVGSVGVTVAGQYLPAGTSIGASAIAINRNRDVFGNDAHRWRPERWLGPSNKVNLMHKYLFSWGWTRGTRRCLGQDLAMILSSKLVLSVSLPPIAAFSSRMSTVLLLRIDRPSCLRNSKSESRSRNLRGGRRASC